MEFIVEYGLFLAKAITFVAALIVLVAALFAIGQRHRPEDKGHIEIRHVNDKYTQMDHALQGAMHSPEAQKTIDKQFKQQEKAEAKARKKALKRGEDETASRNRLFVLSFDGDLKASATDNLREEISAILPQARDGDEVLVKIESPGGVVHGYGLAASQLKRISDAGVPLTVAVDKVAASGGYMMACVAQRIIAAPFAVLGSIGVLAQLPNFHRLLKKHDIDFELLTAGEYKRTLTLFGENTDKGREKFLDELEDTHQLFKEFVTENRPSLDIEKVATGEVWFGIRAKDVGLVDELQTSDSYIQQQLKETDVYEVSWMHKKNWQEKLGMAAQSAIEHVVLKLWQRSQQRNNY